MHCELLKQRDYSKLAQETIKKGLCCLTAAALIAGTMADVALADIEAIAPSGDAVAQLDESTVSADGYIEPLDPGEAASTDETLIAPDPIVAPNVPHEVNVAVAYTTDPGNMPSPVNLNADRSDLANLSASVKAIGRGKAVSAERLHLRIDGSTGPLVLGADYEVTGWYGDDGETRLDSAPFETGEYYIEVTGVGSYHGSQKVRFKIIDTDITDLRHANVNADSIPLGTTPSAENLNLQVRMHETFSGISTPIGYIYEYDDDDETVQLTLGTDYEVSDWYSYDYDSDSVKLDAAPTEEGGYYVEVTGIGDYHGSRKAYFSIFDPSHIGYYGYETSIDYDSSVMTLRFHKDFGDFAQVDLLPGKDYTVTDWYERDSWAKLDSAPSKAGSYYVELAGTGLYTGTANVSFDIDRDLPGPLTISGGAMRGGSNVQAESDTQNTGGSQVNENFQIGSNAQDVSTSPAQTGAQADASVREFASGGAEYAVLNATSKTVSFTGVSNESAKSISVPATVSYGGTAYKVTTVAKGAFSGSKATSVKLGKNVTKVAKGAFSGSKVKTVKVSSSKKPTKSMFVKGCFSGSKVQTVKVSKSQKPAYKKLLTKKYTGTKAKAIKVK